MKKIFLLAIYIFPVVLSTQAKSNQPKWVSKLPMPENETYVYRCESATDEDEEQARNKALAKVMENSLRMVGTTINSDAIGDAIRTGNTIETSDCALIGINPVCSYSERIKGGYRYYILCQVSKQAPTASWQPVFTPFRNCGPQSSNDMVDVDYPSDWRIYESEEYIASFKREHYERGKIKQSQALSDLYDLAERELRSKLGIDEGDVEFSAYTGRKEKILNRDEDFFVVYYISRAQLLNYYQTKDSTYTDYMKKSIVHAEELLDQAKTIDQAASQLQDPSQLLENAKANRQEAEMELQFAQQQLQEAKRYCEIRRAYGADVTRAQALQASCSDKIVSMLKDIQGSNAQNKQQEKIFNYLGIAAKAHRDGRISEALKYYYWSYLLLNSVDPYGNIQYEKESANKWAARQIRDLLKAITFSYAGETPDDPTMGVVNVTYQKRSVKSLDYRYYTNIGWSEAFRAKDGTGVIRFYEGENEEKKLTLRIEYAFLSESYVDKEVAILLQNNSHDEFSKEATKELNIQKITEKKDEGLDFPIALKTGSVRSVTNAKEGKYADATTTTILSDEESKPYRQILDLICDAVRERQGKTVLSYFTPQGMQWFLQLTNSGIIKGGRTSSCRITIVDKKDVSFIRIGENVMARSIKMSFDYPSSHKTFEEDVVFEFDKDKKIDNIRYMLERSTIEDISKHEDWSDAAKMALVDFLEKYKSSYALRNTAYLDSVFDPNALIITGKVNTEKKDQRNIKYGSNENVEYTRHTKESFIKNLKLIFNSNSFVHLSFGDLLILPKNDSSYPNIYGLRIRQDYSVASGYGDSGYLFLLMDLSDYEHPIIHVRTWQPKPDFEKLPGNGLFGPSDFKL